jgi:hypothetical protein
MSMANHLVVEQRGSNCCDTYWHTTILGADGDVFCGVRPGEDSRGGCWRGGGCNANRASSMPVSRAAGLRHPAMLKKICTL